MIGHWVQCKLCDDILFVARRNKRSAAALRCGCGGTHTVLKKCGEPSSEGERCHLYEHHAGMHEAIDGINKSIFRFTT